LGDTAWADPARCYRGEDLVAALGGLLRKYCSSLPSAAA
jgi:hypothetical protein